MVTASQLIVVSGSFTSHSMSVRRHRHLCGHVSHERYTVSTVEERETNLHLFLSQVPPSPLGQCQSFKSFSTVSRCCRRPWAYACTVALHSWRHGVNQKQAKQQCSGPQYVSMGKAGTESKKFAKKRTGVFKLRFRTSG